MRNEEAKKHNKKKVRQILSRIKMKRTFYPGTIGVERQLSILLNIWGVVSLLFVFVLIALPVPE